MQTSKYLISLFCSLFALQLFAQSTIILFNHKSYAGDSIYIVTKADYISNSPDTISRGKVSPEGVFSCYLILKNTIFVDVPLDYFNLTFYIEPGKTYNIQFPPKKKLSVADELNPYFEPVDIIPGIKNADSSEINNVISLFDEEYNKFLSNSFVKAYYTAKKSFADSAIASIEKKFKWSNNLFFKSYKEYKLNLLRFMAYERESDYIIKETFNKNPLYLTNTAYMEAFNRVFAHYFSVVATKTWGANLFEDIAKAKSPFDIKQTLRKNPAITNDTLMDLIILKGLHDAFYDNMTTEYKAFPRKQLLMTLDSMAITAKTADLKKIAVNIKQKVFYLISGSDAPNFALLTQDSVRINLSELRGKYLYINFTDLRSYSNANEMSLLKNILTKYSKNLDLVTICCNGTVAKTREYCKTNEYNWYFLTPEDTKKIKSLYNVRATPSYFLIDPYGKIVLSPAPAPDANFDGVFNSILRGRN